MFLSPRISAERIPGSRRGRQEWKQVCPLLNVPNSGTLNASEQQGRAGPRPHSQAAPHVSACVKHHPRETETTMTTGHGAGTLPGEEKVGRAPGAPGCRDRAALRSRGEPSGEAGAATRRPGRSAQRPRPLLPAQPDPAPAQPRRKPTREPEKRSGGVSTPPEQEGPGTDGSADTGEIRCLAS